MRQDLQNELIIATKKKDWQAVHVATEKIEGFNLYEKDTRERVRRMMQNISDIQMLVVHDAYSQPPKNAAEARARAIEFYTMELAKNALPLSNRLSQAAMTGGVHAAAREALKVEAKPYNPGFKLSVAPAMKQVKQVQEAANQNVNQASVETEMHLNVDSPKLKSPRLGRDPHNQFLEG